VTACIEPSWTCRPDEPRSKVKLRRRHQFTFSSYNVRTLFKTGKFHQLCTGAATLSLDFVAIQEHRWITDQSYETHADTNSGYSFLYSSALPTRTGGVGLLLRSQYLQSVTLIQPISSRVLLVKLKSNPNITIIAAYAPTEDASEQEKDIFYAELERATSYASPHDLLLVGGDFNARVGQDSHEISPLVVGKHGFHDISNANGERLRDFCEAHICISPLHAFHIPRRGSGLGFIRQVLRLIWIIYCAHASGTTPCATAEATTQLIWTRIIG
jgi:hypothetical protein